MRSISCTRCTADLHSKRRIAGDDDNDESENVWVVSPIVWGDYPIVKWLHDNKIDVLFATLNKSDKDHSPTTILIGAPSDGPLSA